MAESSKIQWTHATFNPWWGCTKVSPACDNCYAEGMARRQGTKWGPGLVRTRQEEAYWHKPIDWNRLATKRGIRKRVFCASMADVFEGQKSEADLRERLWKLIEATPSLDWLLLTKRPANVTKLVPKAWLKKWPENVWVGSTVENQEWASKRIPQLLGVPAKYRFVSVEPMFSAVDLRPYLGEGPGRINWVICGGESGVKARGLAEADRWYRDLRDQCRAAGVAFLFKQWGKFQAAGGQLIKLTKKKGERSPPPELDGQVWQQFPDEPLASIEWPADWDPNEGFTTDSDTKPLTSETRSWEELDRQLQENTNGEHSLASRIEALGGPKAQTKRRAS